MSDDSSPDPARTRRRAAPRRRLSDARKRRFLEELRTNGGLVRRAAQVASPHATGAKGALQTFRDEAARDPKFRAAWEHAEADGVAALEAEAVRRAYSGWQERPVVDKDGTTVGFVHKYSDRLMEIILKAKMPEYRDRAQLDVNAEGRVAVGGQIDVRVAALIRAMTREERDAFRHLLTESSRLQERVEQRLVLQGRVPRPVPLAEYTSEDREAVEGVFDVRSSQH